MSPPISRAGGDIPLDRRSGALPDARAAAGRGDPVRVFNGRDGEFEATVSAVNQEHGDAAALQAQMREQAGAPDLWLLFAPLKKARTDFVVEKAVELGAAEIRPVLTERTDAETVRVDRLQRIAIEAAEQTERLDVPPVRDAVKLSQRCWRVGCRSALLIFADEAGDEGASPGAARREGPSRLPMCCGRLADGPAAILIGPEGGFSPRSANGCGSCPSCRPVGLGPAHPAGGDGCRCGASLWQALRGDWRRIGYPVRDSFPSQIEHLTGPAGAPKRAYLSGW